MNLTSANPANACVHPRGLTVEHAPVSPDWVDRAEAVGYIKASIFAFTPDGNSSFIERGAARAHLRPSQNSTPP